MGSTSKVALASRQLNHPHAALCTAAPQPKAVDFDPTWPWFHFWLGAAYVERGMFERGLGELQTDTRLEQERPLMRAGLGYVYARAGRRDEALKTLSELKQLSKEGCVSSFDVGLVDVGLGEKEKTLTSLEKASEERTSDYLLWLNTLPCFASLHSDPHFQDLLHRIGPPTMKS